MVSFPHDSIIKTPWLTPMPNTTTMRI